MHRCTSSPGASSLSSASHGSRYPAATRTPPRATNAARDAPSRAMRDNSASKISHRTESGDGWPNAVSGSATSHPMDTAAWATSPSSESRPSGNATFRGGA